MGVLVAVLALALALAGPASASSDHRKVKILDDCDPATFNAVIGPGTCVGDGETTFFDFIAEFEEERSVDGWEFKPERFKLELGGKITAVNKGGEFHTFTEVPDFGNGCVPELNTPTGAPPDLDCSDAVFARTGVPAGGKLVVFGLGAGTHKFECLIHPWMQSTVKVKDRDRDDDDRDHDEDDD